METLYLKKLLSKIFVLLLLFSCTDTFAQNQDLLKEGFKTPPPSAWPRTWWHWTNSNITKDGITKDLEWMKRAGIAGFQLADVGFGSGQTIEDKVIFGSQEWLDALQHTASEAERLDLEMAIFSSPGWSLTGGPWVKPEQAMKKLVWSEVNVEGSQKFSGKLPQPPSNEGAGPNLSNSKNTNGFYGDFTVIAFPTPIDESLTDAFQPKITSSNGITDAKPIMDNDVSTALIIKPDKEKAWLQLNYDQPFQSKAITIAGTNGIPFGKVLASDDGVNFKILTTIPGKSGYRGGKIRTYTFPKTKAKYYRIEFTNAPVKPADVVPETTTAVDTAYAISEIKIHSGARVNRWEDKAGFNFLFEYSSVSTPDVPATSSIDRSEIIDLTSKMRPDGSLDWDIPSGNWTIMRFGYALTGAKNRPPVPSGRGYEVDKLSPKHVEAYLKGYTDPIKKAIGDLYGKRLQYVLMDSWEAGIQNWTEDMLIEFQKRRDYDLTSYLPILAGRIVENAEISDRFLWDFRRTLVDMFAENHYGTITNLLNQQGIKTYSEAGGVSLESIEDALLNKKYVDIPMGEFWVNDLHPSSMYYEDVRGAASASHIYGKNLVAAEAFTGGNYESPQTLKRISDYWFTQGINQLVFHTSAHQPLDTKPGNTMVGTHIHRNITWAEQAKPLTTYMARNSFMLQRGTYVADIAYLLNEGAPSTMPFWGAGLQPAKPEGYEFDYINADVLLNLMSVNESGKLILPSGMIYSILVLPQTDQMTLPMLRKVKELIEDGATVVGPKPIKAPGLTAFPESDLELTELAHTIWGDLDGISRTRRSYGNGKIIWGLPLNEVLTSLDVSKDIGFNHSPDEVSWIHRRDGETDIYFIVNRTDSPLDLNATFRISGKDVELWHPDNGSVEPAEYTILETHTKVPIHLNENQAVFVVFRNRALQSSRKLPEIQASTLTEIKGKWKLSFPPNFGAPAYVNLQNLISWTDHKANGVKYFSGTGTYTKTFEVKKAWLRSKNKILLDLGTVNDIAEVYVNGIKMDLLWKAPFQVDISNAIKPGNNELTIKVTNQWTNRLVGDREHPEEKVLDAYTNPFGRHQYSLENSGLLGPVKLLSIENNNNLYINN